MKTSIHILLTLLVLGGYSSLQAQSVFHDWFRYANPPTFTGGYVVLEPTPDVYWVVSQVRPFNFELTYFQFVQFEEGAPPFEAITYDPPGVEFMGDACMSKDKQAIFITYGQTYGIDINTEGFVTKLDLEGNIIWEKSLRENVNTYVRSIFTDSEDNVYIGGSATINANSPIEAYIAKLTPDGNLAWSLTVPNTSFGGISEIFLSADNKLYLFGLLGHPDYPNIDPLQIIVMSPEGEILKHSIIEEAHGDFVSGVVDDKGYIYAVSQRQRKIYKIAPDDEVIWKHPVLGGSELRLAPDGNIIHGGTSAGESLGQIKKITPYSELIYDRRFNFGYQIGIEGLLLTEDGGIAVTGAEGGPPQPTNQSNAYLAKFNCEGLLDPDFSTCAKAPDPNPPTVYNLQVASDLLSPYSLGSAFGESAVIHLYDLLGRELRSWGGTSAPSQGMDMTGLTNGWYLYRLESGAKTPQTGKVQLVR